MAMLLITGINGYIGTHLADRCRSEGIAVRGLVREGRQEPQLDLLRSIGVELVFGDLADDRTWTNAMQDVELVAHLIGSIQPRRGTSFEDMHVGMSERCVRAAKSAGVRKAVYLSAKNARPGGVSRYYDTKGRAEQVFEQSGLAWAVVRPVLVYGHRVGHKHSKVMMKYVEMARNRPVFKTVGDGENRVQPIHIEDLIACFYQILTRDDLSNRRFDLAGPRSFPTNRMLGMIAAKLGCPDKPVRHVPRWIARVAAFVAERVSDTPILTTDQLRTMKENMTSDARTVEQVFGIEQRSFEQGLDDYASD